MGPDSCSNTRAHDEVDGGALAPRRGGLVLDLRDRPGAIRVEIVPRPDFDASHWDKIKEEILKKGDPDLDIEMVLVNEIALEASNKRRFVISRLEGSKREIATTK